jgi:hypothetical protein
MSAFDDVPEANPLPPAADAGPMQTLMQQLLAGEEFGGERESVRWGWEWRRGFEWPQNDTDIDAGAVPDWLQTLAGMVGSLSHILLWLLLLVLLLWVWSQRKRFLPLRAPAANAPPAALFDVRELLRPEALPEDITAAASTLWQAGRQRDALALLYRAALHRLGHEFAFTVPASGTEQECRRLVDRQVGGTRAAAFARLVACWTRCAWAHQLPPDLAAPLTDFRAAITPPQPAAAERA